jgi:hypothetical protein
VRNLGDLIYKTIGNGIQKGIARRCGIQKRILD